MNGSLLSFNSVPQKDSTVDVEFIIHDFELSLNGAIVSEQVCVENANTIINKPILAKYVYDGDNTQDYFTDHEVTLTTNRDTGDVLVTTDTVALGVFTGWEIKEVNGKRVFCAKGVLWSDRYYNACSLLYDMFNSGTKINTSCEYLYSNYKVRDGVQHIESPIVYDGHCILNSRQVDDQDIVLGAYESSQMTSFNQAINTDLKEGFNNKQNNGKGEDMENRFIKALNGLSVGELSDKVYAALRGVMTCDEYYDTYVSDYNVFYEEKFFIYHVYKTDGCEYYKVTFELDADENMVIDFENRQQVKREQVWVTVETAQGQVEEVQQQLNSVQAEKEELEKQLNAKTEEIVSVTEEKITLSEQIVSLNSTIAELEPFKAEHDKAEFEKALNERVAEYEPKFAKFNALEVFNSDEVQGLIKDTLDVEKGLNAKLAIYEKLDEVIESFNMIEDKDVSVGNVDKNTKSLNNLVPTPKSYVDKFGFDV